MSDKMREAFEEWNNRPESVTFFDCWQAAWQAAQSVPVVDVKDGISSPHNACQHRNECRAKAAELERLRKDAENWRNRHEVSK